MIYDYICMDPKCEFIFEFDHGMSENPDIKCIRCGRNAKRYFGNYRGHVKFKGKGFYVNDYKSTERKMKLGGLKEKKKG